MSSKVLARSGYKGDGTADHRLCRERERERERYWCDEKTRRHITRDMYVQCVRIVRVVSELRAMG